MAARAERVLPGRVEVHPCRVSRSAALVLGLPRGLAGLRDGAVVRAPALCRGPWQGGVGPGLEASAARLTGCATEYGTPRALPSQRGGVDAPLPS